MVGHGGHYHRINLMDSRYHILSVLPAEAILLRKLVQISVLVASYAQSYRWKILTMIHESLRTFKAITMEKILHLIPKRSSVRTYSFYIGRATHLGHAVDLRQFVDRTRGQRPLFPRAVARNGNPVRLF